MKRHPLYIFDLDGTLFRGVEPIPGAAETVAALVGDGAQVRYVTNNSTQVRATFVEKLARMGFPVRADWVYSSALATGEYLRGAIARAFVVGEEGLVQALAEVGIARVTDPGMAQAVVVGLCRRFDFDLMTLGLEGLTNPDVRFVASNEDATYPLERGRLIPGAGAIVASLAFASGRRPEIVGKPNPFLIEWILGDVGISPSEALVVGDRVETDIEAGRRAGCEVHLVLSGVQTVPVEGVPWSADICALV